MRTLQKRLWPLFFMLALAGCTVANPSALSFPSTDDAIDQLGKQVHFLARLSKSQSTLLNEETDIIHDLSAIPDRRVQRVLAEHDAAWKKAIADSKAITDEPVP